MHNVRLDLTADVTNVHNATKPNTEKENDSVQLSLSVIHNTNNVLNDLKNEVSATKHRGKSSERALVELRTNTDTSPIISTSKSGSHGVSDLEMERMDSFSRPPVSFVVTRLPKQFVVSCDT